MFPQSLDLSLLFIVSRLDSVEWRVDYVLASSLLQVGLHGCIHGHDPMTAFIIIVFNRLIY